MPGLSILHQVEIDGEYVAAWAPFPTDLLLHSDTTQNGTVEYLYTPPVAQGPKAVRVRATRHLDKSGKITSSDWCQERCEGWSDYASRTNWAGSIYGRDPMGVRDFRYVSDMALPKALYRKWMPDVWRFVHAQDAEKLDDLLSGHANWVAHEDQKKRSASKATEGSEARYGRVEHGDIYLTERPISFQDGSTRQAFLALRKPGKGSRIKSYILPRQSDLDGDRGIYPVAANYGRMRRSEMFKLCQASLDDIGADMTAHEKIELVALQQQIHAHLDRIQIF